MKSLLLVLALFAGTQSKGAEARLSGLVTALGDASDVKARSSAYMTLMHEKPAAVIPLLVDALPRYDVQGQQYGLWLLQSFPIEESRLALHRFAGERWPLLAAGSAAKLLQLGEREMLEPLVKAFTRKDTPSEMRRAMLQYVFLVKDPRLSAVLRSWIAPESDAALLGDVLYQLLEAKDLEARARATELASAPGLTNESRAACEGFLIASGEDARGPRLAELLASDNGLVFSRLQRFLLPAPRLSEELVSAIAGIAERATIPTYAQFAIAVLGQHAGPKQIPVLEKLLDSPNMVIARAALEALQKRGATISHETLLRMLDSKEGLRVLAAADALRRMDDFTGFERVLGLSQAGGADKAEVLRVLAKFRRRAGVRPLLDALEDSDAGVRSAAEQGLYELLRSLYPYRRFDFGAGGFLAQAAPEKRAEGLRALRAWCAENLKP